MTARAIEPIGIGIEELERIVDQAMAAPLTPGQHRLVRAAIATLGEMARLLNVTGTTVQQLRQLVLGRSRTSEKTAKVLADAPPPSAEPKPKPKRKGHGRNKACEYTGARRVPVEHATLRAAALFLGSAGATCISWCPSSCCASPDIRRYRRPTTGWPRCAATCAARCTRPRRRPRQARTSTTSRRSPWWRCSSTATACPFTGWSGCSATSAFRCPRPCSGN